MNRPTPYTQATKTKHGISKEEKRCYLIQLKLLKQHPFWLVQVVEVLLIARPIPSLLPPEPSSSLSLLRPSSSSPQPTVPAFSSSQTTHTQIQLLLVLLFFLGND
jgi:hypothetical protein